MPPVTVLSWNIENLGAAKTAWIAAPPSDDEITPFIALLIEKYRADLVGIMEIRGGLGEEIRGWLVGLLNNHPGSTGGWTGRVSAQQDGLRAEETLYLWNEQAGRLTLDLNALPAPVSHIGIVDDNLLEPLYTAMRWSYAEQDQLYDALAENRYITNFGSRNWWVVPDAWQRLNRMRVPQVKFDGALKEQPPPGMGVPELTMLARMLLDTDILQFLHKTERTPFLANFLLGPSAKPLSVALLHAPGPEKKLIQSEVCPAVNTIAMSRPLTAAAGAADGNVLIMGDFNVDWEHMQMEAPVYGREDSSGKAKFCKVTPAQKAVVFSPLTGSPIGAKNLMVRSGSSDQPTTVTPNAYADNVDPAAVLVSEYDKFLFRSATPAGSGITSPDTADVLNPARFLAPGQPGYDADLARKAVTYFRRRCGDKITKRQMAVYQQRVNRYEKLLADANADLAAINREIAKDPRLSPSAIVYSRQTQARRLVRTYQASLEQSRSMLQAAQSINAMGNGATNVLPTGTGSAAYVYRKAVSDHCPILVELTA